MKLSFKKKLFQLIKRKHFDSEGDNGAESMAKMIRKLLKRKDPTENFTNIENLGKYLLHPNSKLKGF